MNRFLQSAFVPFTLAAFVYAVLENPEYQALCKVTGYIITGLMILLLIAGFLFLLPGSNHGTPV